MNRSFLVSYKYRSFFDTTMFCNVSLVLNTAHPCYLGRLKVVDDKFALPIPFLAKLQLSYIKENLQHLNPLPLIYPPQLTLKFVIVITS